MGDGLALSVIASQCHLSQRERLWHSASLPVSFCRSLWYTCFAPGACALTPDQQDGVGEKPAAVAEELVFSNSMPTSWKNGALPRMSSCKKIADYFGITVEELMGTKKEPAGMGELDKPMQEIVELLFVVSIILCYNSYKLKSRGKRNIE
ncbi:MAG: hypothetical protein ACLT79_01215 [Faecalibacterium prausnitzii]